MIVMNYQIFNIYCIIKTSKLMIKPKGNLKSYSNLFVL